MNQQNGDQTEDQGEGEQPEEQQQNGDEPEQNEEEGGAEPKELNADQERMLNAIQAEEDKTQEKLKEGEKALVIPGKKNW